MTTGMDYSAFSGFPFPAGLVSEEDRAAKEFFYALPDEEQLRLLNGCSSYDTFHDRVTRAMKKD